MLHPHITLRKNVLKPYRLRKATITDNRYILNSCQFQELKKQINDVIKYPYATLEWYIKAIVIIIIEISLECHSIWFGFTLMKSTCIGIFMALIGLCIQHDANHGAISPNCSINMLWGLAQDWIGGSSLLWKHHHVLMHHAYTNMNDSDPDATTDIIRLHSATELKYWHKWQGIYTWFLLPLLPISWHFKEIWDLWSMRHMGRNISDMAYTEARIGIVMRLLFLIRFYVVPLYIYPSLYTMGCILFGLIVGGAYLGFNFIISHNFEGVKHTNIGYTERDWCRTQVETSSTVGGRMLGYLHGGLNYQIEHHLFPRICHVHYYKMKPIIQLWAQQNGISYKYFRTLPENIKSCYQYLVSMGNPFMV
jgi:fatty acid desaturase (delta-4 desaturase)